MDEQESTSSKADDGAVAGDNGAKVGPSENEASSPHSDDVESKVTPQDADAKTGE